MDPCDLTAAEAAAKLHDGSLTAEALTRACLARCAAREPEVKAFSFLDPDLAIANARRVDKRYDKGVLHGLPLGVKDMIDACDMPTSHNSPIYEGLRQGRDAACVAVARGEGAVIFGKTDTVEFAAGGRRALTRNPHDTIGWYGRSVADLRLVAEAFRLFGLDAPGAAPAAPRIGLCRGPNWALASTESQAALLLAGERLQAAGIAVEEVTLPATFGEVTEGQRQIAFGEGRGAFLGEYLNAHALLHQDFRDRVENSGGITAASLRAAYDHAAECRKLWDALFPPYDGILTVAAVGEAPVGRQDTGDHVFNAMWTLLHVPCIGMPCTRGPHGAPVGVQVIGPRFGDAALLDIAARIAPIVGG